jgi:exosortase
MRSVWLAAPFVAALALYARIFPALIFEWSEFPTLSHGFAIPFIAAYLLWVRRRALRTAESSPSLWGAAVLVAGLTAFLIGTAGQESFIARISFPVSLLGLVWLLGGTRVARQAWPGIAYLLFMIPPPWTTIKALTYQSRLFDAWASWQALHALGVPVLRDGFYLQLPNVTLEVADVCSSIPALTALLALVVAYATLASQTLSIRLILIGATIPFAILSNIVRITTTAAAAYYLGPWTLRTVYHQFNGTVIFLFTLALLYLLDRGLARWGPRR